MRTLVTLLFTVFIWTGCQSDKDKADLNQPVMPDETDTAEVILKRDNTDVDVESLADTVEEDKDFLDENGDTLNTDKYDRGVDSMRLRPGGRSVP